jgi:molecular chaperone DnaK (HSP70)
LRLGIDFGTTRTVVACADRGNHPVVDFVDEAGDSRGFIPSVVAERDGELRFGLDALAVADDPSFTMVRSFKRLLSRSRGGAEIIEVGSSLLRADEVVAGFLSHVRHALLLRSNLRRTLTKQQELRAAVGVPANAYAAQRLITLEGFRRAGFAVTAIVNEPSAAGFEYTHRHRDTLTSRRDLVVVYDLGGGTFDASVVRMTGHHHEILATAGLPQLGGDDFDAVLAEIALAAAGIDPGTLSPRTAGRWLEQCRLAKESLHPNSRKVTIDLEAALGRDAPTPEVSLSTATFYDACLPLIARSIEAMAPLMSRANGDSSPDAGDIAGVYVVGGASELPVVGRVLRERFGRRVHRSPYLSAAVAIGLAIACDEAGDFRLVDRYSRVFGVFREADDGREIVLDPIFGRDVALPTADAPVVSTRSYRARHNIGHYRFFECSAIDERGRPRGDMTLRLDVRFPFDSALAEGHGSLASCPIERRVDEGPRVVERYSLDRNGLVHVSIRNADTGYEYSNYFGE